VLLDTAKGVQEFERIDMHGINRSSYWANPIDVSCLIYSLFLVLELEGKKSGFVETQQYLKDRKKCGIFISYDTLHCHM
jgi:hypothetical protein